MTEKMTDSERHAAAKKRAREQFRELEALRAEGATSREIQEMSEKHDREIAGILGDQNQPAVGSMGGPNA